MSPACQRLATVLCVALCAVVGCEPSAEPVERISEWRKQELPKMRSMATRVKESLNQADSMELVYLVPEELFDPPNKESDVEYFDWWKVSSRLLLDDAQTKEIAAKLVDDLESHWDAGGADCFEPRHALRLYRKGTHLDVVLCFQCVQLWCFDADGNRSGGYTGISKDLQPLLDSLRPEPEL